MTYLWEVLLKADEQCFPRERLRFTSIKAPAPYMEVANTDFNRDYVSDAPIEINSFYRFGEIFNCVVNELDEYPELKECLFDILMHYVAEVNMYEGLCIKEYHGIFLYNDVKNGKYGKQYENVFQTFAREQVRFVIESMVRLYEIGPSITLFQSVMRKVYPRSISYLHSTERREMLVYIGKKESPELNRQVNFLLSMFVPFDYVIHLFWDKHFGLIGVNETLELDEFVVY